MPFPAAHPEILGSQPLTSSQFDGLNDAFLQPGKHTHEILEELGLNEGEKRKLVLDGALGEEGRFYNRLNKL